MKCSYAGILFIAIYHNIKSKQCLMCKMNRACILIGFDLLSIGINHAFRLILKKDIVPVIIVLCEFSMCLTFYVLNLIKL